MSGLTLVRPRAGDRASLRARAAEHGAELDVKVRWLTIQQLHERWGISVSTIRAIPFDELPYLEFGRGAQLKRRRYHPAAVARYEERAA